ncbi:MAG: histidine kinase dimerization/phosphoacceptor domain -containing protein [Candidatus Desulfatibia sp.]|uniref:histidine kinase dimerization/phosphoacceptor domain -containing protein n=1 Tax=Candidatus Desulfatibia sp. TaxID=3101189 RepID=UPI002F2FA998
MYKSIRRDLSVGIGLVVLCVSIIVGSVYYFISVKIVEKEFNSYISQQTRSIADMFSIQLWLFDLNNTKKLGKLLLNSPQIAGLILKDHNEEIIFNEGVTDEGVSVRVARNILYENSESVGHLEVFFSNTLWMAHKKKLLTMGGIIVTGAIVTIYLLINILINKYLSRPLENLQKDMASLSSGKYKTSELTNQRTEVQNIIDAFNELCRKLEMRDGEISEKTVSLEKEISERKQTEASLKESESRYRTFFEQDSDGVVVLDLEAAELIEFNDQVCRQLGYSKEEFALLRVSDIEAKETAKEIQAHIRKISSEGYDDFETLQRTKQGEIRHVHVTAQMIEIAGHPVCHCIWRDITDRKQAEEKIKSSLKEKEVLLSEIHHRVKNNMQVIISLLNLQADKIEDKKYADILKKSQNRILSMALVHEQLYQSKDFANIDFGEYVKSFVNSLSVAHGVDTNKVKLNIDINDISFDLENAIPCGLIINELVSNSLKHAFPRQREGNISIALQPTNEDELELTVSDDGVGIPEDLDIEQTDTMGLHLVKMLAEQLEGKIELNRTEGTQFHFLLKRAKYKPRI